MNEPALRLRRTTPAVTSGLWPRRLRSRHVCTCSYFPHHKLHRTASGVYIHNVNEAAAVASSLKVPAAAPGPVLFSAEQLAHLLDPAQLHVACSSLINALLCEVQTLCQVLAEALQQAKAVWQHVVMHWPAWRASLCEDAQYVLHYALGVVPAWLVCLQAAAQEACASIISAPGVQQMVTTASDASRGITANLQQVHKALAQAQQQMVQSRLAKHPPLHQLLGLTPSKMANSSTSSSSIARGLTHSMAALTAADLAAPASAKQYRRDRRSSRAAEWTTAAGRAQLISFGSLESFTTQLAAALTSSKAAASSGLQHIVVEPLQHAGFISSNGRTPTVAGVIAAASVLLAGSVYRSMRRNAAAAEERLLQQVQLQMKAESLAAQRARFRRALGDAQAAAAASGGATNSRRRTASPVDDDAWEDTTPATPLAPAGSLSRGAGTPRIGLPQLDADAAREYQKFMAGAKAMDVPMWDSHMVEDLPKVSMKELQRQTQKIRAAATADERAAMEDTELRRQMVEQQLNSQLQELSGAPVGRAAREAWRKEQQQRKVQEQQALTSKQAAAASEMKGSRGRSNSNPFAIPAEARAKWDAEDHIYTDVKPKASSSGGWGFGFGGSKQQPQQNVQQKARRRRFADDGETPEAVPATEQQSSSGSVPKASVFGSVLEPPTSRSPGADKQQQQQSPATAAVAQVGATGPAEATAEWEAQMREEVLRSGAARRARRQQMLQQHQQEGSVAAAVAAGPQPVEQRQGSQQVAGRQPAPAVSSGSSNQHGNSGAPQDRVLPEESLNRPKWPGGGGAGSSEPQSDGERLTVLGRVAAAVPNTSTGNGGLSTASVRDVHDITASAAAPSAADTQRMQVAAVARAEAAAEARAAAAKTQQQEKCQVPAEQQLDVAADSDDYNPFAVDRGAVLDDEEAFELGKQVDKETRRIRLQF